MVSNHSGTVPVDGLMTMVTLYDHTGRFLRPLGADLVFQMPFVSTIARQRVTDTTSELVMSVAPALGPTVSGLILQVASWRWMFGVVLPIALAITDVGLRKLTNVGPSRSMKVA